MRENVEEFFKSHPLIKQRIKSHWKKSPDKELSAGKKFPLFQLEQQFVDYTLKA